MRLKSINDLPVAHRASARAAIETTGVRLTSSVERGEDTRRGEIPPASPKPRKYHNNPVVWNGIKFPSERQLRHHRDFLTQQAAGAIRGVMREVSIPLLGTTRRVRIDHVVVENDGRIRWYDSKGILTPTAALKYKQLLDAYGVQVELL